MHKVFSFFSAVVCCTGSAVAEDAFTVRDEYGRTTATVESYLWTDRYVIRDRSGRTQGTIEPSFWGDGYVVRDRDGRTMKRLRAHELE